MCAPVQYPKIERQHREDKKIEEYPESEHKESYDTSSTLPPPPARFRDSPRRSAGEPLPQLAFLLFNMQQPTGGGDMRPLIATFFIAFGSLVAPEISCGSLGLHGPDTEVTIYDSNPSHLWNRLHATIFVRPDVPSTAEVPDALDPPLWFHSKHLLAQPSHARILRILDEFLETHGERLIQDPGKRAMLQRDLWAVFDWSVEREPNRPEEPAYEKEKLELQPRLVEIMRRIALTPEQIRLLPSNYAQAVASGLFAKEYDPAHPDRPFLPPDLFDLNGPWVEMYNNGTNEPFAVGHQSAFSRSAFLILIRLPGGRKATFDYFRTLWDFPQPWIPRPDDDRHEQTEVNPELPQFPVGTQVALARQMILFDSVGNLQGTPITESVQIRVYRSVASHAERDESANQDEALKKSGQDFYQFTLSRSLLFASKGLKATAPDEREFSMFNAFGPDEGSPAQFISLDKYRPVLKTCFWCHLGQGIDSVNSRSHLLKPDWLMHEYPPSAYQPPLPWWGYVDTHWKQNRYDWGLLSGYWKATGAH